jgi:hypothetical protein
MKGYIHGYPTSMMVESESDGDKSTYMVRLCDWPLGVNDQGAEQFNGSCTCRDFECRKAPQLKNPLNRGKVFRCKHLTWARNNILDIILPALCANDPNKNQ